MKARYVYLLTSPTGGVEYYSNLEALAADTENKFSGTTRAVREARAKAGGFPVAVKGFGIDKKLVKGKDAPLPETLTQYLRP